MRFPLLALLADGPAHGYDLKRRLEEGFGSALPPVNAGQIYTTLARLERDGLVEAERVAQNGRPNKRVYELTADGRAALRGRGPASGSRSEVARPVRAAFDPGGHRWRPCSELTGSRRRTPP